MCDSQVRSEIDPPQNIALLEAFKWWLLTRVCENTSEKDPRLEISGLNEYLFSVEIPPMMREMVQSNLHSTERLLQPEDLGEVNALYCIGLFNPEGIRCHELRFICVHPQIREKIVQGCAKKGINSQSILKSIRADWDTYSKEISKHFNERSDALSTLLAVLNGNETTEIRDTQINKDTCRILMRGGVITEIHPGVFTLSKNIRITQVKEQFEDIGKEKELEMGRWIQRSIRIEGEGAAIEGATGGAAIEGATGGAAIEGATGGAAIEGGIKVLLGHSREGEEIVWRPSSDEANPHFLVVGGPGFGKSNTLKLIVSQLRKQNVPYLIIDFKNEYGDVAEPLENGSLNPLEIAYRTPKDIRYEISSIISNVFKLGAQQQATLRNIIGECYIRKGIDNDDKSSWNLPPPAFADVRDVIREKLSDEKTQSTVKNTLQTLQNRLDPLFDLDLFQGQSRPFEQIFQTPSTFYLRNLPNDEIKAVVSDLILRKLWYYVQQRGGHPLDHFCVIDEAHRLDYEGSAMITFLREARSYGVGMILSSQSPRDFTGPAKGLVSGFLSFQLSEEKDASPVSKRILCKPEDIQQLTKPGEGIVKFGSEKQPSRVQVIRYP